jgi:hypothetical protein
MVGNMVMIQKNDTSGVCSRLYHGIRKFKIPLCYLVLNGWILTIFNKIFNRTIVFRTSSLMSKQSSIFCKMQVFFMYHFQICAMPQRSSVRDLAKVLILLTNVGKLGNRKPTNVINVYKNKNGTIHGTPGISRKK